jgi:hypothetical protein
VTLTSMIFSRQFSMPNPNTFTMHPVARLLDKWLAERSCIVDPFARDSQWATLRNDLNPKTDAEYHLPAEDFLEALADASADAVLFDPPYSPRQISECYQNIGLPCGAKDTQNARLYKAVKDQIHRIIKPGGLVICCGWNSMGMGTGRGYSMLEILLVPHGGAHNDTIVTVERK